MFKPEIGTRLPNTVELEVFLEDNSRCRSPKLAQALIGHGIAHLERFAEKFRGEDYPLLEEGQVDADLIRRALISVGQYVDDPEGRRHPYRHQFVSRQQVLAEIDSQGGRERCRKLFRGAHRSSLRHHLDMGHVEELRRLESGERSLENLLSMSLGSKRLLAALDRGFGYSFSHIVKDDIVAFWTCYFAHVVRCETKRVRALDAMALLMRQAFPIMRTSDPHPTWTFFVQ
jgi:hypothetical protein